MRHPFVGTRRIFTYPDYGTPDSYPDLTAHSGQTVTVLRQLTDEECDPESQPMFKFRASDGFIGSAHGAELDGTVRPLRRQDYKFAMPEGTGDRYLTTEEINAAIAERDKTDRRIHKTPAIAKLAPRLVSALRERGHSDEQIAAMTGKKAFDEYCHWHGLIGWGDDLWRLAKHCRKINRRKRREARKAQPAAEASEAAG